MLLGTGRRTLPRLGWREAWGVLRYARYYLLARNRIHLHGISIIGRRADLDVRRGGSLSIGDRAYICDDFTVRCNGKVTIGSGVYFNRYVMLMAYDEITIGDNTLVGPMV